MEQVEQTLAQLVRDSQSGDRAAQERLVQAIQDRLYFYCRMMTSDWEEALDATQDVLIKMLERLGSLQEPEAFWGWLRQIAVRVCLRRMKRIRGEWRRKKPLEEWDEPELAEDMSAAADVEGLVEQEEVRQAVLRLVNNLPPQQKICVLLYYYEEMSVEDISGMLKVPIGTVKSRLHYARKALKQGAEASARRGFPLYGLSPLPLIRAVILQEAAGPGTELVQPVQPEIPVPPKVAETPEEPDPPTPEEPDVYMTERSYVESMGINGYGSTNTFALAWGNSLPPLEMTYTSSNPEVVVINKEGVFTTLSEGTAVLSATQTVQEDFHDLTVEVQDRFNWKVQLPNTTLQVGQVYLRNTYTSQWSELDPPEDGGEETS